VAERWRLELVALGGERWADTPPVIRLRAALKRVLRDHGLKALTVTPACPLATTLPPRLIAVPPTGLTAPAKRQAGGRGARPSSLSPPGPFPEEMA
jgi:hypothetical protein